jgi:hypothetical protein
MSILEHELGGVDRRVEIVTNGVAGEAYWPALNAWPDAIREDIMLMARRYVAERPSGALIATSAWVLAGNPQQLCFALHFRSPAPAKTATDNSKSSASGIGAGEAPPPEASPPPAAAPIADQCRIAGCGE